MKKTTLGFSLLECLLALALGAVVILMLCTLYTTNNRLTNYLNAAAIFQEQGRFLSYYLPQQFMPAGYLGCVTLRDNIHNIPSHSLLAKGQFIEGYTALGSRWAPALPKVLQGKTIPGSDVVTLAGMNTQALVSPIRAMNKRDEIWLPMKESYRLGEELLISDCQSVDRLTIKSLRILKNGKGMVIISNKDLSRLYAKDAEVAPLMEKTFFIATTSRQDIRGQAINALYTLNSDGKRQEILPGVVGMRLEYATATGSQWVSANVASQSWSKVRFHLLLNSMEVGDKKPKSYYFFHQFHFNDDGKFYKEWVVDVALRESL